MYSAPGVRDYDVAHGMDAGGVTYHVGRYYEQMVPQQTTVGEIGQINNTLTHVTQTVVLSRRYVNPVVFAQPLSTNGGDTAVVRITDVQADRFTLYVHEAPDEDGTHGTESVSYLVLEAGTRDAGRWPAGRCCRWARGRRQPR